MAANPTFIPLVGSGFDSLASQRAQWAGFNNNTERANMEAFNRANDQRNQYIFNQDAIARQGQAQADAEAENRSRFDAQQAFNRERLAAEVASTKDLDKEKQAMADAKAAQVKLAQLYQQAQGEIEARTFDPKNYKELPQELLMPLIRQEATLRDEEKKSYFDALNLAGEVNKVAVADKFLGTRFTPQVRANKELDQKGVKLNPQTGYFEPAFEAPAWLKSAIASTTKTTTNPAPVGQSAAPAWVPRAVSPAPIAQPSVSLAPTVPTVQTNAPVPIAQATPAQQKAKMANLIAIQNPTWTRKQIIDEVNRTFQP